MRRLNVSVIFRAQISGPYKVELSVLEKICKMNREMEVLQNVSLEEALFVNNLALQSFEKDLRTKNSTIRISSK